MQKSNPLRLADERILVEQLRLLLGNVGGTLLPITLLAALTLWVLSNDGNRTLLSLWCAAVMLSNLNRYRQARGHLASDISFEQARRMVWVMMVMRSVDGALWGMLAWITLETSTPADNMLVIAVVAGMAGGAVSTLSPLLPLFIAFIVPELGVVALKVWTLGDPAYNALGATCVLYFAALLDQARNSARAARAAIELRFENVGLLEKLQVESAHTQAARRQAEIAQQAAEQANAAKSKFLAAVSHDLRQPIHAQGLFLGALARTELDAHQREVLANASATSKSSVAMLNTLLDFSRIEAGVVEPRKQAFRLQPLLNKIEREFGPLADAKGIAYRSRETNLVVESDPMLTELILRNLVSNAIRYTERGGLLVAFRRRGTDAVLEVWDTGIGIAPDDQQAVFREFLQLAHPQQERNSGLGLGLAIVDGLARSLGHRLSLASRPQRGSVFRLCLPVVAEFAPIEEFDPRKAQLQTLNLRVLVIDDDEPVRTGMLHLLSNWGCECDVAESVDAALALAQAHAPDVVISDYRLREQRNGLEAIVTLRKLLGDALPALLITGDTAPDRLRETQASGIPLLHKPVAPGQLYRELARLVMR